LKEKLEKTRIEAGLGVELPEDAGSRTIEDGLDVEADAVYYTGGSAVVYGKKCPGAKIFAGLTSQKLLVLWSRKGSTNSVV
jgi:hypothetical protein